MGDSQSHSFDMRTAQELILYVGNLAGECDEAVLRRYIGDWVEVYHHSLIISSCDITRSKVWSLNATRLI